LEKALDSAINQNGGLDYEIVVVDNDPDSVGLDKIKVKYNFNNLFYYINDENIGMFGNWNRCIELVRGEYITILHDDDWLSSDYLMECETYLNLGVDGLIFRNNKVYDQIFENLNNEKKNVLFKNILSIFSNKTKKLSLFDFFLGNKSSGTLGVLLKTKLLKELGGYNPDFFPSSDYVLHANYSYRYNLYLINKKLNYYRIAVNESAKQETLEKWVYIDNEIRKYIIPLLDKNQDVLLRVNKIIQDNRVKGLVDNWNYQTETMINYKIKHKIFNKMISLKYFLNF
jgi:hypothetical protein